VPSPPTQTNSKDHCSQLHAHTFRYPDGIKDLAKHKVIVALHAPFVWMFMSIIIWVVSSYYIYFEFPIVFIENLLF
jgi:hypothetical protein